MMKFIKLLWDYFQRLLFLFIGVILIVVLLNVNLSSYSPIIVIIIILMTIGSFGVALNIEKLQWGILLFQWLMILLTALQFVFVIINCIFGTSYSVAHWF